MKPYVPISERLRQLGDQSEVLKLDWNEATVPPSPKVAEAIHQFIDSGRLQWYPSTRNARLIEALSAYSSVPTDSVQYFAGSDDLHEYVVRAFIDTGDTALIVSPTYDSFRAIAESAGANTVQCWLDSEFGLEIDKLHEAITTHRPKLVYLCNPNNPTGTQFPLETLRELFDAHGSSLFVIDEAYVEFGGESAAPLIPTSANCVITRTFSKAFALASFRIGYALSATENLDVMNRVRNPKSVSVVSQVAAQAALEDIGYMQSYVAEVLRAKSWFVNALTNMGLTSHSGGGNFILVDTGSGTKEHLIKALEERQVFVRDLSHIPRMQRYLRVTVGTTAQMQIVAQGFSAALGA